MHRAAAIVTGFAIAALLSCGGGGGGHAPVARFSLTPRYICAGDNHVTVVRLDARLAADPVDDPTEKALPCTADADCTSGRVCRDTGAPADPTTKEVQKRCLYPLQYAWDIEDGTFVKTDGGYAGVMLAGTFAGDRPYRVTLTVTDRSGDSASIDDILGVTTVYAAACAADLDCPQGFLCADPLGKGKGCYANCEVDEGICNYCAAGGDACAKCYVCQSAGDLKLCLPPK